MGQSSTNFGDFYVIHIQFQYLTYDLLLLMLFMVNSHSLLQMALFGRLSLLNWDLSSLLQMALFGWIYWKSQKVPFEVHYRWHFLVGLISAVTYRPVVLHFTTDGTLGTSGTNGTFWTRRTVNGNQNSQ